MDTPNDGREVRRGLEAALLAVQTMAAMMDRLGWLLENWEQRAAQPTSAAKVWRAAADDLRAAVTPAGDGTKAALRMSGGSDG